MASTREYTMLFALNASLQNGFPATMAKANQSINLIQKSINDLNKQQGNIRSFEKLQSDVDKSRSKLELYQKQLENLKNATAGSSAEEAKLQNAILAKEAAITTTSQKLEGQTQALNKMGAALEEAGIDTNNLTSESKRLEAEMEQLRQDQEAAGNSANTFAAQSAAAVESVASAIAAAGIADKMKEVADAYMETVQVSGAFEASMSQVAATMGVSNAEVAKLSEFAKEMGASTSFSAVQASEGLNILAMAGLSAKDQMSGLPVVLDLAAAGGLDLADSATYVTGAVAGFRDSMEHAGYYADLMAKGASLAKTDVRGLGEAFSGTAANASSYNQAADSVTLALLRLADQNVVGSSAATALNRAYADLFTPTAKEAKKAIAELGVQMYDVTTGEARDFNDIVDEMAEVLSGYTQEEANALKATIFTAQGLNAFNKMTAASTERVEELWKGIGEAGGAATQQAATQLDNMNGELTIMQSAAEGLQISLGDLSKDTFRELYRAGTEVLTMVNNFVKENPSLVKGIITTGGLLIGLTGGITSVAAAIKAVTAAASILGLTVPGVGPIMATVAAVSALGGAIAYMVSESDGAKVKELNQETRELKKAMSDLHEQYDDTVADNHAAAETARMYIDRLRELESVGEMDEAQKKEYHNILELLVDTMPELADKIDLVNNTIEGGLPALEKATNDWEKLAEQQAKQEYAEELQQNLADAIKERTKNEISLTAAQTKGENASRKQQQAYSDLLKELGLTDEQFRSIYNTVEDLPWRSMSEDVRQLRSDYIEYGKEVRQAADEERVLSKALEESQAVVEAATADRQALDNATKEAGDGTEGLSQKQLALNSAMENAEGIIRSADESLLSLKEAYDEAYDAAEKSIRGQYQIWDEVSETVAVSADTINQRLAEQTQHWQEYNQNLESLRGRTGDIEGLSDVIASFADGSQESINAIAGMAEASDEDLAAMVTNYQNLQAAQDETGENIAALATNLDAETQRMAQSVEQMVSDMNLSGEAEAAARETIQAYISTASSMQGEVGRQFAQIRAAALSGLNSGGGGSGTGGGIPKPRAAGGPVYSGKTYLVGEEGPELIRMSGNGTVVPNEETNKLLSTVGSSGNTYKNDISVSFQIGGDAGQGVIDQLRMYGQEFADRVLAVVAEAQEDNMRRSFAT